MATETENLETLTSREDIFGDPTPNAVGRNALVSHRDSVVHLDKRSAPRLLWYGEDLLSVKLPTGVPAGIVVPAGNRWSRSRRCSGRG